MPSGVPTGSGWCFCTDSRAAPAQEPKVPVSEPKGMSDLSPRQQWYCNHCGIGLRLVGYGPGQCSACHAALLIWGLPGRPRRALSASECQCVAALVHSEASCAVHGNRAAVGVCERCGDLRCLACTRVIEGRSYCAGCVPHLARKAGAARDPKQYLALFGVVFVILLVLGAAFAALTRSLGIRV